MELIIFIAGALLGCAVGVSMMCICIWSSELSKKEGKK